MTATPETTQVDHPHLLLADLAQQGKYAFEYARAGQTANALEHLDAIDRLTAAYRSTVVQEGGSTEQPGVDCPAGLLPLDDLAAPVERCVVRGRHTTHETAEGRKWTNADAGIEEVDT